MLFCCWQGFGQNEVKPDTAGLKKLVESSDVIVDGTITESKILRMNNGEYRRVAQVKVNKVLKGGVNAKYLEFLQKPQGFSIYDEISKKTVRYPSIADGENFILDSGSRGILTGKISTEFKGRAKYSSTDFGKFIQATQPFDITIQYYTKLEMANLASYGFDLITYADALKLLTQPQNTALSRQDSSFIYSHFIIPNAEIFEVSAVSHENFAVNNKTEAVGHLKAKVIKSFSSKVHCGNIDVVTGYLGTKHFKAIVGNCLISCTRQKNGTLKMNSVIRYSEHGGTRAYCTIGRTLYNLDDYNILYKLLPKPSVCCQLEQDNYKEPQNMP